MPDTMLRPLRAALTVCLLAGALLPASDAQACNVGGVTRLIWPPHDGLDASAKQPVPVDTQVWLGVGVMWDAPSDVVLKGPDGQVVDTTYELRTQMSFPGVQSGFIALTPTADLSPETTYTVVVMPQWDGGPPADFDEGDAEDLRERWQFTTSDGAYGADPPSGLQTEYVALEREQSYQEFCTDHVYDTVHVLRVPNPSNVVPILHTFELTFAGEATQRRYSVWTGANDEREALRVELSRTTDRAEYPCITHVMTDIAGRTHRGEPSCAPSFCLEPPLIAHEGSPNEPHATFSRASFDAWRRLATPCSLDPGFGCSTAPASPIPHAPLALTGLGLLGLLGRRSMRPGDLS